MSFWFSSLHNRFSKAVCAATALFLLLAQNAGIGISIRGCYDSIMSLVSYSFYEPTFKINRSGTIEKNSDYTMYLAKNEREACQIAFRMRVTRANMKVSMTEFKNESGNTLDSQLYQEYYVQTNDGSYINESYPDATVPVTENTSFAVRAENNAPFYISVRSDENTPSGLYTAEITIFNANDDSEKETMTVEVKAYVWDFTLPQTPSCTTSMGLDKYSIAKAHGVDINGGEAQRLYEDYYEFLLDHKVSPYKLPVDILSDEADKYMSDPRVTSFVVPYPSDDALLQQYYEKISSNEDWARKAYFYPIDEPDDEADFARYNEIAERLQRLCPGYNMATPFFVDEIEINGEKHTGIELQKGKSNIICSGSQLYSNKGYKQAVDERVATGDRAWWYVCCAPQGDYCNLFTHWDGIKHRILFWQQKDYDVEGLLYWETAYWKDVNFDPWSSAWTTPWTGPTTFGDGSLLYNGNKVGIDGPVSSLRLEAVTNGIEDYEYLTMAEELLGEKYTDKIIGKITKDLEHYTLSDEKFTEVRIELGKAIEAAVAK